MEAGERHTREHVLEDMDRCGIDAALVSATPAVTYDPLWANQWLIEQVAPYRKRLFPMWTAMPHHTEEFPEPLKFIKLAKAADVRAIRIYPKAHNFSSSPETLGPLMKSLATARLPVFIHRDQFVSAAQEVTDGFDSLRRFLDNYRANRIVILGLSWGDFRYVVPIMEQHKNWLMEFSSFQANEGPEMLVRRFGASRFMFGSDAPSKSPGAARAFFDWTGLNQCDTKAITAENLCSLLGIRTPPATEKTPADDIVAAQWSGQPLDHIEVLDAHIHVCHEGCQNIGASTSLRSCPAEMKRLFRSLGIRRAAASAFLGVNPPLPRLGNDITYAALQTEPDFMIGYACMDPVQMSTAEIAAEIKLRYEKQGFLGLKPYLKTPAAYDDPRYRAWYQYAGKRRLFALFHCSGPAAGRLAEAAGRVATAHRGLRAILAHSGASFAIAQKNSDIALANPNVYCEITYTNVTNGAIELLAQKIGAARVLFGTDAPMRDPRPQLGWVVHTRLSRKEKTEILGVAFKRILKQIRT